MRNAAPGRRPVATWAEMAGIAHRTLPGQFRHIDPHRARVVPADAADRVLPTFGPRVSAKARRLRRIGVEVRLSGQSPRPGPLGGDHHAPHLDGHRIG